MDQKSTEPPAPKEKKQKPLTVSQLKRSGADHLEMIHKALQNKSLYPHDFFGIALIIAQGVYYCGAEITLPGHLQPAVQAFLDHPPDKPSRQAGEEIAQALFDVVKFNLKIKFVEDEGKPFWTVEKKI